MTGLGSLKICQSHKTISESHGLYCEALSLRGCCAKQSLLIRTCSARKSAHAMPKFLQSLHIFALWQGRQRLAALQSVDDNEGLPCQSELHAVISSAEISFRRRFLRAAQGMQTCSLQPDCAQSWLRKEQEAQVWTRRH